MCGFDMFQSSIRTMMTSSPVTAPSAQLSQSGGSSLSVDADNHCRLPTGHGGQAILSAERAGAEPRRENRRHFGPCVVERRFFVAPTRPGLQAAYKEAVDTAVSRSGSSTVADMEQLVSDLSARSAAVSRIRAMGTAL